MIQKSCRQKGEERELHVSSSSVRHASLLLEDRTVFPCIPFSRPLMCTTGDAFVDKYLDVGPPVYFVTSEVDVTAKAGQRHLCGRFTTCDEFSVANVLEVELGRSESSFLSQPAASWIDDYLHWLNPANGCCRVRKANPNVLPTRRPHRPGFW